MSQELTDRSQRLLERTRQVWQAVVDDVCDSEFENVVERQLDAFTDFSRCCDPDQTLCPTSRGHVDEVLIIEHEVVQRVQARCESLQKQRRALAARSKVAGLFEPDQKERSRFIACRA